MTYSFLPGPSVRPHSRLRARRLHPKTRALTLLSSVALAGITATTSCGDAFTSCQAQRTCPSGGAAGDTSTAETPGGSGGDSSAAAGAAGDEAFAGAAPEDPGEAPAHAGSGGTHSSPEGGTSGEPSGGTLSIAGASGGAAENGGDDGAGNTTASAGGDNGGVTTDPDACDPNPCENGGTCMASAGTFKCSCQGGHFGPRCENAHFEWLGVLRSDVAGISADGNVVVGTIPGVVRNVPARWTRSNGFEALEATSEPVDSGRAIAASSDGSVIVGQASLSSGSGAFRWTANEGVKPFGLGPTSIASGVSENGNTIVGWMDPSDVEPEVMFRWTAAAGVTNLGVLVTRVGGLSADGTVAAGMTNLGKPFRWTQALGREVLGSSSGWTWGLSHDGSTIVGDSDEGGFIFKSSSGYSILSLEGLTKPRPRVVNRDGSVLAGFAEQGTWIWNATDGARLFTDVLSELGADLSHWSSVAVTAISADGKVLAGTGYLDNQYTSWIARFE